MEHFLKKGLLGTAIFATGGALSSVIKNEIDELKELEVLGFNHIQNAPSKMNANTVLHKANTRGHANHGWLDSHHTFSFANYYNPERMHFGVLRVLNDDVVAEGRGFGTHPHDNMEIISIPLDGDLQHKDSMGNTTIIRQGDIQVMSAGTGIQHSEFNANNDKPVKFLQIWIFPNKRNVTPRYDQISLKPEDRHNRLQQILSPSSEDEGVWIHQNAWFHMGKFDEGISLPYEIKRKENGVYLFVISGNVTVDETLLESRDAIGIWNTESISIKAESDAEFLIMDIPMKLSF
jgi:redox-sensitive bicupin YhaK (pirin superfamily)